jgi:hypothetical protein
VIAPSVVLLLLAAAPALPEGRAAYRVEIGGVPVGRAELTLACATGGGPCRLEWSSELRLPAASGGVLRVRRIAADLDRDGRAAELSVTADGATRAVRPTSPVAPASGAELLLAARGGGCLPVLDEEGGSIGRACATGQGHDPRTLRATILGAAEVVTLGDDGFPDEVDLPAQRTRYVRDPAARVPDVPPAFEVRVPGPPDGGTPHRFCGLAPDPPAGRADLSRVPRPRPDGRSCREQAAAYAAAAERAGLPARIAVGVADDGQGFVWHAWAEVRTAAGWIAVDPAFGQLPARGPRFTIARHGGDAQGLAAAGSRILACWGRATVE